jgi:1-phosphofructokinase family hexose kinase
MATADAPFQLVLSGSLPPNVPVDLYSGMIATAHVRGGRVILDTSGEALLSALGAKPDLAKPNREEAEHAVGFSIDDKAAAITAAERLCTLGSAASAISLGSAGMVWTDGGVIFVAAPPRVEVVSTVGCGDAAVAGFAIAAQRNLDPLESVRLAVACGTANCLAKQPGQIADSDVHRLLPLVTVRELSNAPTLGTAANVPEGIVR